MRDLNAQEKSIFINTICGQFSNKKQADKNPSLYAHINIYFRLLPWSLLRDIGIYTEQSYDHSPWTPYRQSVNKLIIKGSVFIMENYEIKDAYLFAGGGFNNEILSTIKKEDLFIRESCEMNFYKSGETSYKGHLKQKHKHIIERNGRQTYLVSKVQLDTNKFLSIDEGFDIKSEEKVWGSEHGYLEFLKLSSK